MPNQPFQREVWSNLSKALSSDNNQEATYADIALRQMVRFAFAAREGNDPGTSGNNAPTGFIADCFQVSPTALPSMQVILSPGIGFQDSLVAQTNIGGIAGVNDPVSSKPMYLDALKAFAVPANAGAIRYDLIEAKANAVLTDNESINVLNPGTGAFGPVNAPTTLSWSLDAQAAQGGGAATAPLFYKVGAGASVAAALAALDVGYVPVAIVHVATGVTEIDASDILDVRPMIFPGGEFEVSGSVTLASGVGEQVSATLAHVVAPPGVKVGAIALVDDDGTGDGASWACRLFLFCGKAPSAVQCQVTASVFSVVSPSVSYPLVGSQIEALGAALTTPDQDALAGNNVGTTPAPGPVTGSPLEVAIGAPVSIVRVQIAGAQLAETPAFAPLKVLANLAVPSILQHFNFSMKVQV